jgi:hypothetical protein
LGQFFVYLDKKKLAKGRKKVREHQLQKNFHFRAERLHFRAERLHFLQWFAGFTDAEGNFNISLRNFQDNKYNSLILTFQIGLHIDDLDLLKFIQRKLNCGHISISGNRCNYFVNDQASLIHIILPIFNYAQLNSSKYFTFLIFQKAVNLIKNKRHLSPEGKLKIIKYYNEMQNEFCITTPRSRSDVIISDYWLGGFIDGDGSFSSSKHVPRLKFENHVKELKLFEKIKEYLDAGNLNITQPRKDIANSNPMVVLEINKIHVLKNVIIPLLASEDATPYYKNVSNFNILQSKKVKDFYDWSILVNIYYYGYHTLPEGISLTEYIKARMNNWRLSTRLYQIVGAKNKKSIINTPAVPESVVHFIDKKISDLFSLPAPYDIKNGVRYFRGTDKLVATPTEKLSIMSRDNFNNKSFFSSMTECSKALHIGRSKIKKCLLTGESYNNYNFYFYS